MRAAVIPLLVAQAFFACPYYFVILAQKKSNQPACFEADKKTQVQKSYVVGDFPISFSCLLVYPTFDYSFRHEIFCLARIFNLLFLLP